MSDLDLLSQLTSETFKDLEETDYQRDNIESFGGKVLEFSKKEVKFTPKINILLENIIGINPKELKYNSQTKCYNLSISDFSLDIPANWSVFRIEENLASFLIESSKVESEVMDTLKLIFNVQASSFLFYKVEESLKIIPFNSSQNELAKAISYYLDLELESISEDNKKIA